MRCIFLRTLLFSAAAFVVLAAGIAVADDAGALPAASSDELRVVAPSDAQAGPRDAPDDAAPAVLESPTGIPTPAKHKQHVEPSAKGGALSLTPTDEPAKSNPADPSLRPIVDLDEAPPAPLEAASFKGVVPGASTADDVAKAWGQPKKISQANGALVQLYSVAPFKRVEVSYADGKVSSIVIRLDRSFPADLVAKTLNLTAVRPVFVSNEMGEILGQAFPERGVLFALEPSDKPRKPSMKVSQIILEPISAESFVLRAETTMDSRYDLTQRDLEQALTLDHANARAHWLYGRVMAATEHYEKAAKASGEAVHLDPDDPQYRVTHAQALAQSGQFSEAIEEAQKGIEAGASRPHVKARATCLVGDLLASGPKPDFKKAIAFHTGAIQIADPLSSDPHPAIRVAAKEVLVDAYLGAAHDIAWGEWREKPKAVARWLDRAVAVATDLVANEGGSEEQLFRVYARALAAYVGVRGNIDPAPAAKVVAETGEKLVAAARDPGRKAQLQREVGMALYDAVQVWQMRAEHDNALKYGETASGYLASAVAAKSSPVAMSLLGRLYFRLGMIHAMRDHDHKTAVALFDKAVPFLDRVSPEGVAGDSGRQGEAFVSMSVSYWEAGQRDKAVELTQKGIRWMEQAAKQGTLDKSFLAVPYSNLAAMHRKLGADADADRYQEMASRIKGEKLK